MKFGDILARSGADSLAAPRHAHLLSLPAAARAKLAAIRSRLSAKPAPAKAKGAGPVRRVEPTVTQPKASASPPPTYSASSFTHLGALAGADWSAMWEGKAAAGATASVREERARMLSILGSPEAAKHPPLAAHLAFATDLNSTTAINLLSTAAPLAMSERRVGLSERMAAIPQIRLGTETAGPAAGTPEAMAQRVLGSARAAGAKF